MDWTMIGNASGKVERIKTLYYLLKERYRESPEDVVKKITEQNSEYDHWSGILPDLKEVVNDAKEDLGVGTLWSDAEVRQYFKAILQRCPNV